MSQEDRPEGVSRELPLFPLGIVALPSESVPLHVFEDRYKRMIEHCLSAEPGSPEGEFGIVWLSDEELKEVGCACEIERVLERMDDGRMNILARGTRPFRLLERQDDLPYPAGVVEFLTDQEGTCATEADKVAGESARELYRDLVEQATDRTLGEDELAAMDAYEMAGTVEFGTDAKQELLELRSESARLRLLALLLKAAIKRLELIDRAQARAMSNGKVRFG
jgi:Lon protease-like protein